MFLVENFRQFPKKSQIDSTVSITILILSKCILPSDYYKSAWDAWPGLFQQLSVWKIPKEIRDIAQDILKHLPA